ncbi:MAG: hypothetical protein HFI50_17655 [Lachnospiraceae bacterium]|nr:hypothetical protein [Lachnospiraceae bacterium]
MKKRFISICLILILIRAVYMFADKYQYSDALEQKVSVQKVMGLNIRERVEDCKEIKMSEMILALKEKKAIEQYFGIYEITSFWPTLYYGRGWRHDFLLEQEADMMLGHIVEIEEESLITYECFRWNIVHDGKRVVWTGNYQIEKVTMEDPQYEWESIDSASTSIEEFTGRLEDSFPGVPEFQNCREKICGRITVTVEEPYVQEYYVMEDGIMMYSTMTGEYFYLKKLDKEPNAVLPVKELSEEEKEKIIQEVYGTYTITEFLPTKYYPALDVAGDVLLPQEEADMALGREITIGRQSFITYDNGRLPNSEAAGRSMEEYLLKEIEIITPDYQIERKRRDDIYGLRDDMLSEEMQQDEYIEINVFPGYGELPFTDVLPQMYLLNDGRLLLYAMGEYFLLEKNEVP